MKRKMKVMMMIMYVPQHFDAFQDLEKEPR